MVKSLRRIFCIFLTSCFAVMAQTTQGNYCFENSNRNGILPLIVCFEEIRIENWGKSNHSVYLRNYLLDELFPISRLNQTSNGSVATVKGDYINYVQRCGITILSTFEMKLLVDKKPAYIHHAQNSLVIRYEYSADSCREKPRHGTETYSPVLTTSFL